MSAAYLNSLHEPEAQAALRRCCGAQRWVTQMLVRRPFRTDASLHATADIVWSTMHREDILEAFRHHPKIGADIAQLRARFAKTHALSASEQSGVATASEETLRALKAENDVYESRFGFIFIVCASGKSATEMLSLLRARMDNEHDVELRIAAAEQAKITHLRLNQLHA